MVVTDQTEYLDELLTSIARNRIEEVKTLLTSEELERRIQKRPGRSWMGDDGIHFVKFYQCDINEKDINNDTPLEAYIKHYQKFKKGGLHSSTDVIKIIARAKVLGATLKDEVKASINSALANSSASTDSAIPLTYDSLNDDDLDKWNHERLEEWSSYLGELTSEKPTSSNCVIS